MTHVVCEPCYDCKYTDCVAVCPVECFYQDDMLLYIDPADCIDCEACVPECPVEAIFSEANVPAQWASYIQLNADKAAAHQGKRYRPYHRKARCQRGPFLQEEVNGQLTVVSCQRPRSSVPTTVNYQLSTIN